jgi:preprotein translocase subunit SecG
MTILFYAILVVHILVCFILIGVVLLQQGKNQDLASAFGGGGSQTAFGPRGSANVLTRATAILAAAFMVTSLALSVVRPRSESVLDRVQESQATEATDEASQDTPSAPAPASEESAEE